MIGEKRRVRQKNENALLKSQVVFIVRYCHLPSKDNVLFNVILSFYYMFLLYTLNVLNGESTGG